MYKIFVRPILFLFSPETIHSIVFSALKFFSHFYGFNFLLRKFFYVSSPSLERIVCGIKFPNPVGLAAGFDKNAELYETLANFGFGFIEIGTVTPQAQSGNPKPRAFRLKADKALINRMGFNNSGMKAAAEKLKNRKSGIIIGGNIGKNTTTANENAIDDYTAVFDTLHPVVDYFVVNVSCPNIKDLRKLQDKDSLLSILQKLEKLNNTKKDKRPILLKISPDLSFTQIDETLEIIKLSGIDGIVATNTTTSREGLSYSATEIEKFGNGGLSGQPLKKRSTEIIRYISQKTKGELPIIAVGGIFSAEDAIEKIDAGATLVQLYTGFIYEGPALIKKINNYIITKTSDF